MIYYGVLKIANDLYEIKCSTNSEVWFYRLMKDHKEVYGDYEYIQSNHESNVPISSHVEFQDFVEKSWCKASYRQGQFIVYFVTII